MIMMETLLKYGGGMEQTVANENKTLNYETGAQEKNDVWAYVCMSL